MKWGRQIPDAHDLSSLRLLGSVGEPINPEAWRCYRDAFGANKTPVVDTWWQTETGAIMISPLPGVTEAKPGSAMTPLPGISAKIVDEEGNELVPGADEGEHVTGYLVLDKPWPSMLRGIWGAARSCVGCCVMSPKDAAGLGQLGHNVNFAGAGDLSDLLGDTSTLVDPSVFEAIRASK